MSGLFRLIDSNIFSEACSECIYCLGIGVSSFLFTFSFNLKDWIVVFIREKPFKM